MPDIPQSERRGDKLAVTYYNRSTGDYELRPLLGGGDGSAHVIDAITQVPRYSVTPTIAGKPAGLLRVDGGTSAIRYARVALHEPDLTLAATRLYDDADELLHPGLVGVPFSSDTAITDVWVALISDAFGTAGVATGAACKHFDGTNAGALLGFNVTADQIVNADSGAQPSLIHYQFSAADDVRVVRLTITPTWDSDFQCTIRCGGASHA